MFYDAYQVQEDMLAPMRVAAGLACAVLANPQAGPVANSWLRWAAAGAGMFSHTRITHHRPAFAIAPVSVAGTLTPVHETIVLE